MKRQDIITASRCLASYLLALVVWLAAPGSGSTWAAGYQMKITFAGYTNRAETLTNFPLLVVLSNGIGGGTFNFGATPFATTNGYDLRFQDAAESNLNYEIEAWNTNSASYIWVQAPTVTGTGTGAIWAKWGDLAITNQLACTTNGATWTNGYGGVWHLGETVTDEGSGETMADSTGNGNNGTHYNSATVAGQIGAAQQFDGNGDYVNIGNKLNPASGSSWTVSCWFRWESDNGAGMILYNKGESYEAEVDGSDDKVKLAWTPPWVWAWEGGASVSSNRWYHYMVTYNRSTRKAYLDGVEVSSVGQSTDMRTSAYSLDFGRRSDTSPTYYYFNGKIDEMRIEPTSRSSNWVWACWLNQASNTTFSVYDAVIFQDPNLPQVANNASINVLAMSAMASGTLFTNGTSEATVYLFYATNDCMTNDANWIANGMVTNFGPFSSGAVFTNTLSGLLSNTWYYWNHMASNATGKAWAAPVGSPSFKTRGAPGVDNGAGATNIGFYGATLNGNLTNGVNANVYINWWTNGASVTNLIDFGPERAEGGFSTNLTGLTPGTTYGYQIFASNAYGTATSTPTNFNTTPLYLYVALTGGSAPYDGSSWAHAYTNLQDAIDAACASQIIYIAGHTFSNSTAQSSCQYLWTNKPLTIMGGYAADGGTPGALTNTPTILTRTGGTARILYISGLTSGTLQRVTLAGGYLYRTPGAGLYVAASSNLTIGTCAISNNYNYTDNNPGATKAAGAYLTGCDVRLTNCVVTLNTAYGYGKNYATCWGGGIYIAGGAVSLDECVLNGNWANGHAGCKGGGVYLESGNLTISNSVIMNNKSRNTSDLTKINGYGGGFYIAAGTCTVWNTLICGNEANAGYGYGLRVEGGSASINNCTVASHAGDAVNRSVGTVAMTNSILWGNSDDIAGAVTLACCDVEDGDNNGTNGCFSADPQFQYGFYLAPGSPCVNTGNVTAAAAGLTNRTTRVDSAPDEGVVDLGYHYAAGFDLTYADIYVAPDGDDVLNNGTNAASPFRTITKALATATDGSRIHIAAGSYTNGSEVFPLTLSGKSGVELLGANRSTTIVNANGANQRVLTISSASGVTRLEGLTFTGGRPDVGGLYLSSCSDVAMVSCVVSNNRRYAGNEVASYGGGIFMQNSGVRLANTLVMLNNVYGYGSYGYSYGGGIYMQNSLLVLENCLVDRNGNTAEGNTVYGGGIHMASGVLTISNSVIRGNSSKYYGGGVSIAAGTLTMWNTLLASNKSDAANSDGVYVGGGAASFLNCTIATNYAVGIRYSAGTAAVTNCIVWGHTNADLAGWPTIGGVLQNAGYSLLGGPPEMNGTNGCIVGDPLFVNMATNNYTPQRMSPCVNNGLTYNWMTGAVDLAGNPRVNREAVDIGAYEFQWSSPPGTVFAWW